MGLLHKGFFLNFSQKIRKINDVITGTESFTSLGWRAHTTFNNCRGFAEGEGDSTRVSPGGTASLMLWPPSHRLEDPHIYFLHFLPALLCKKLSFVSFLSLENRHILSLKLLIYVSQYTCFLKCGRKLIKLKSTLNTNLFLWFNAVGNHKLPDSSGVSESAL